MTFAWNISGTISARTAEADRDDDQDRHQADVLLDCR
jgi:hypothetical protein